MEDHTPFDCVVDASVGIKLFLLEPLSEEAHALFAHLADDTPARLFVPELFYVECANILWKYVKRYSYPAPEAAQAVAALVQLPLQRVAMVDLAEEALELAVEHGCTAYDAAYMALARSLELPLITVDDALVRRFADTDLVVRSLASLLGESE